jgi:hypothetical protein
MRSVLVALLALLPATALADKSYTDKSATHDCAKEPNVSINTGDGTFTFTGKCEKIAVNGGENKVKIDSVVKLVVNGGENVVDVEAADKIAVNGSDNTVNYKRGISGKAPKVASIGNNNKLNQVK